MTLDDLQTVLEGLSTERLERLVDRLERDPDVKVTPGAWRLTERLGDRLQLGDIFVTNATILRRGIDEHVANSILIKLNQIGTVTQTLETIELAPQSGYRAVISHRSGDRRHFHL